MYQVNHMATTRLINEYEKYKKLIIAVDFDNTIYDYHNQGLILDRIIKEVKRAVDYKHEVYIFTANNDLELVKKHCFELGLGEVKINESSIDHLFGTRKPFYNLLLDDRAGLASSLESLKQVLDYQECYDAGSIIAATN